jgi:hypothetical protein
MVIDSRSKGMSSALAQQMPFEDVSLRLREAPAFTTFTLLVRRVCVLTSHGAAACPEAKDVKNVNVRIFMAAYMIAFHPDKVFEVQAILEKNLIEKATKMLKIFDKICDDIITSENWCDIKGAAERGIMFPGALHAYLRAFQEWKIPDEKKLNDRIKHVLSSLQEADDELREYDVDFMSIRSQLRSEKKRLLEKLRQIIGVDAVKMIEDVRVVMGKSVFTTEMDDGVVHGETYDFNILDVKTVGWRASPNKLSNEQIAHELLLDENFEVNIYGGYKKENPARERMRTTFHKAFWDSLADDLRSRPVLYVRTLHVFHEVKTGVKRLESLALESQLSARIDDVIDFDLINQMIEKDAFTWKCCTKLISDVFSLVQRLDYILSPAPIVSDPLSNCNGTRKRKTCESKTGHVEQDIVAWGIVQRLMAEADLDTNLQPVALCEAVRFLLNTSQFTASIITNKRLKMVLPVLRDHGVEYERDKMELKLSAKSLSLKNTTALIHFTISNDVTAGRMNIENLTINESTKTASYTSIMNSVVVELVVDVNAMTPTTFPEVWHLDSRRIVEVQSAFKLLVRVGSVVVIVGSNMQRFVDTSPTVFLDTLIKRLLSAPDSEHDLKSMIGIVDQVLKNLPKMDQANRERICGLILMNACSDGKLAKLLLDRYRNVIRNGLCGDVETFKDNDVSLASFAEMKIPRAIHLVSLDVRNLGLRMRPMVALHAKVHSERYNEIITSQSKIVALQYAK